MKNYVAKLRENEEKGFSLVELIIVMAIMAILVGIVASQVLPYMDKSRQSKDQQQLSSVCTNLVSAVAQSGKDLPDVSGADVKTLDGSQTPLAGNTDWTTVGANFKDLNGGAIKSDGLNGKLGSKNGKGKVVLFDYDSATGEIKVYVTGHGSDDADSSKYIVVSK